MCKISQTEAYNSLYNYDFICISETFFDSSMSEGHRNFQLNGYQLKRVDHPSNTKREGVCICHKEFLSVRLVKLSNLSQCIVCEVFLQNYKGYIGVVYRSPSQDNIEFESFLSDFDELLRKTASSNSFTIILGVILMLDLQLGGNETKLQQKVHICKHLHHCITLIKLYQNTHTYYPILVRVLI